EIINKEVMILDFNFKKLRKIFLKPPSIDFTPHFRYPNIPVLKAYLKNKFSQKRLKNGLSRLKKAFDSFKMHQQTIDNFLK
ncbi:MAG: hypothetical protein ACTSRG_21420, partial [Candidatus Helarchaeota archaeon]